MIKKVILFASMALSVLLGVVSAQGTVPVSGTEPPHPRIFELKERIQSQRDRISQALHDNTISNDQAQDCRTVLDGVEKDIQVESAANGPHYFMRRARYEAYNARLDVNSSFIRERKQTYYYYGDYYDQHESGY